MRTDSRERQRRLALGNRDVRDVRAFAHVSACVCVCLVEQTMEYANQCEYTTRLGFRNCFGNVRSPGGMRIMLRAEFMAHAGVNAPVSAQKDAARVLILTRSGGRAGVRRSRPWGGGGIVSCRFL